MDKLFMCEQIACFISSKIQWTRKMISATRWRHHAPDFFLFIKFSNENAFAKFPEFISKHKLIRFCLLQNILFLEILNGFKHIFKVLTVLSPHFLEILSPSSLSPPSSSSSSSSAWSPPQVLLFLAGLLLCLHLSEGFSYRGNVMRNRNRGSGSRSYLRTLGGGGRQRMGGMGFGKRAYDFYNPGNDRWWW